MSDDNLRALRSEVCHAAADWLEVVGNAVWLETWLVDEPPALATALVTQMVGQVGQEAADAYDRDRWYAGASLTRQVVECTYLLARFRDEPEQGARWINASANRIETSFRPGQMRKAGGFRHGEYKIHCTWGGHPSPFGRWLLPNHSTGREPNSLVVDLAQHLTQVAAIVEEIVAVLPQRVRDATPDPTTTEALANVVARWYELDPLSQRVADPVDPVERDRVARKLLGLPEPLAIAESAASDKP